MNHLCGIRLHTVGVVVGWIGAVASFIAVALLVACLANLDSIVQIVVEHMEKPNVESVRQLILVVLTFYVIVNCINLCASSLLVAGTIKERHLMLIPWLFNSGLSLIFACLSFIGMTLMAISSEGPVGPKLVAVLIGFLSLAFQYIIWSAIYSLYKVIQSNRDQQQRLLPQTNAVGGYPVYTKI